MEGAILAGRKYTHPAFWGPLIPAILFLVLGIVAIEEKPTGTILLGIAAAFTAWTAGGWIWVRRGRRWIEVRDGECRVTGPDYDRTIRDGEVRRMSCVLTRNYSQGVATSVTCRVRLWTDDGEEVELQRKQGLGPAEEFARWAARVQEDLSRRSEEALRSGGEVEGEGWALTREELRAGPARHPVGTLSGAGTFDGHVCVWKKGEEEAVFKVPQGSANAMLLEGLLAGLIPKEEGKEAPAGGLGRVLFERRASRTARVLLWLLWGVAVLGGLGCMLASEWVAALVVLGFAGLLGFWIWCLRGSAFRCHEHGVMKVGRFGRRTMRYRDIGEFTYGAVRMYYNGVYTGTTLTMKFVARPPAEREKISYSAQVQTADEELDSLRDHISRVIAVRMDEELAAGRPAVWTPNLTFHPDGIEYRAAGFIGRKEPVKIPYSEVTNFGLEQGVFHLWVAGKEKSVMQEQVSAPNFFPGYVLLSSRFRSAGSN